MKKSRTNVMRLLFILLCAVILGSLHPGPALAEAPQGMVLVPAGEFVQGGSTQVGYQLCLANNSHCKEEWFSDEGPVRRVHLDAFYLDTHEVTQNEFQNVMRRNPSEFKGGTLPVDSVTWHEASDYCRKVDKRLPTEAEWEKAAKGGQSTLYPWGNAMLSGKANFCDKRCNERWNEEKFDDGYETSAPVGSFPANALGLFDMTGNVYEWVADWYGMDYYQKAPNKNPQGPRTGSQKSMRGGSWINYSTGVRPADRTGSDPEKRFDFAGFRCAKSVASP